MSSGLLPRGRGSSLFTDIQTQTLTVASAADINYLHVTQLQADSANVGALTVATVNGSPVPPGGFGDVRGPASSTDNSVVRFDGTTGKLIQGSAVTIGDTGAITGIASLNGSPVATGTNTGDVTLTAVGASPNANGATLTGQALTLQPANGTFPGVVTAGVQSLAGAKTFLTKIASPNFPGASVTNRVVSFADTTGNVLQDSGVLVAGAGSISGTNTGDVTLAAFGATPNANGASLAGQVLTLQPASATLPGGVSTVAQSFLGTKFFTNGIQLNALQVGGESNTLGFYETNQPTSALTQWSGPFAVNPTPTRGWSWEKIGARGFVDLSGFQFAGNLLTPAIITSVSALPTYMRPPTARIDNIQVVNSGNVVAGTIIVLTTGVIQIGVGNASTAGTLTAANNFVGAGAHGILPWQVQYVI